MRRSVVAAGLAVGLNLWPGGTPACHAQAAGPATVFVRKVGNEVPRVLANTHSIEERRARLVPFVTGVVDIGGVTQFCLGRFWQHATPQQQQELDSLFVSVLVNTIALWTGDGHNAGLADGSGKSSVVMLPETARAGETYVPTVVTLGDAPAVHVTWVVSMQDNPPRILDVIPEGMSVRVTLRSDFVSYLSHHGGDIDGLIGVLRQRARATGGVAAAAGSPG